MLLIDGYVDNVLRGAVCNVNVNQKNAVYAYVAHGFSIMK